MKKAKVMCLAGNWVLFEDSEQAPIILAGSIWDVVNYANKEKINILNKDSISQEYQFELWDSIEGLMLRNEWAFVDIDQGTKSWTKDKYLIYLHEKANASGNQIVIEHHYHRVAEFPNNIYYLIGFLQVHNI